MDYIERTMKIDIEDLSWGEVVSIMKYHLNDAEVMFSDNGKLIIYTGTSKINTGKGLKDIIKEYVDMWNVFDKTGLMSGFDEDATLMKEALLRFKEQLNQSISFIDATLKKLE